MKLYSLTWEDDDPIFDFKLLGIKTNISRDYTFVFLFNKFFSFSFKRIRDHKIYKDGLEYNFSAYKFYDIKTKQNIELISNTSYPLFKEEKNELFDHSEIIEILVPEYKFFNYFLKYDFLLSEEFYVTLKKFNFISNYEVVDLNKIKKNNLENLILIEE